MKITNCLTFIGILKNLNMMYLNTIFFLSFLFLCRLIKYYYFPDRIVNNRSQFTTKKVYYFFKIKNYN